MKSLPLHDLAEQNISIKDELNTALKQVVDSGSFIRGENVSSFENNFANYLSIDHCIGVGNATDGLHIALQALELPTGSEIIIPANAHVAPALAALNNNLKPVFADVDFSRMLINADSIRKQITPNTKVVVAVHLYGLVCPMQELSDLCNEHDLILLEDFSQAQGADSNGIKVGSYGRINVCSFYPTKPLGALGDGGAITTSDPELMHKCRALANYGSLIRNNSEMAGRNSRLDEIQASVLNVKLNYLDQWNAVRVKKAQALRDQLKTVEPISSTDLQCGDICHLFVIKCEDRAGLISVLKNNKIECDIHYPIPIHKQALFNNGQQLPTSEEICNKVLSMPVNDQVLPIILKHFNN